MSERLKESWFSLFHSFRPIFSFSLLDFLGHKTNYLTLPTAVQSFSIKGTNLTNGIKRDELISKLREGGRPSTETDKVT